MQPVGHILLFSALAFTGGALYCGELTQRRADRDYAAEVLAGQRLCAYDRASAALAAAVTLAQAEDYSPESVRAVKRWGKAARWAWLRWRVAQRHVRRFP